MKKFCIDRCSTKVPVDTLMFTDISVAERSFATIVAGVVIVLVKFLFPCWW